MSKNVPKCPLQTHRCLNGLIILHLILLLLARYKKEFLGGYLAHFSYLRRCTILKVDPFTQILEDIALYYNLEEWRSFGDAAESYRVSTEMKQRMSFRKGVDMVIS